MSGTPVFLSIGMLGFFCVSLNFKAFCRHYSVKKSECFHYYTLKKICRLHRYLGERFDKDIITVEVGYRKEKVEMSIKEAIKEFLAQQAVLSSHVGQHTIQQSVDAPTVEASALTAKYGIQMLESAARITERLARIDQPRQGNVFATQANVGVNQQIVNDRPRTVRSDV